MQNFTLNQNRAGIIWLSDGDGLIRIERRLIGLLSLLKSSKLLLNITNSTSRGGRFCTQILAVLCRESVEETMQCFQQSDIGITQNGIGSREKIFFAEFFQ